MKGFPLSDTVLYAVTDAVATITLNRPQALNAVNRELGGALLARLHEAAADAGVRAVVLTGAGRAFCAGQDLGEHADTLASGHEITVVTEVYNPVTSALATMPKPVVAAVNGVAAGAGASFAFASDVRLMSDTATIRPAFAAIGLAPDSGMSWTLQRLVGLGRASALLLLGEAVSPDNALTMGLVNAVVPAGQLAAAALEIATRLAAGPTLAYAATKRALAAGAWSTLDAALALEQQHQAELARTSDHANAVAAFLSKQAPLFEGR
jgi:2-(1,2-epoxy-1,2-dihydrophenyl)acetyl-CoA isomerase